MQDQRMDQPLQPAPLRIDLESLYMLFDEMTDDQLKDLIEDAEQEIDLRRYHQNRVARTRHNVEEQKYRLQQELEKEKQRFKEEFEREKERVRMGLVKQQNLTEEEESSYTVDNFSSESDVDDVESEESDEDEIVEDIEKPKPKPKAVVAPVKPKAKAKAKAKPKKVEEPIEEEEEPKKRAPIKRKKN